MKKQCPLLMMATVGNRHVERKDVDNTGVLRNIDCSCLQKGCQWWCLCQGLAELIESIMCFKMLNFKEKE